MLGIIISIVAALILAWFSFYVKRPRLIVAQSGYGGGPSLGYRSEITIRNMPALLGLRMGQTIIFGHKIHPPIQKGLTLERTEAKECTAEILDKRTKKHLAPLWWRVLDSDRMVSTVDIPSGKNAELMLFAQKDENSARYFIYKPISESDHSMVVPPDGAMYTRTKSFLIVISSYGRRKWMFETAVTIMPDGKVTYRVK